jgi:CheY-like chemotaxis protein
MGGKITYKSVINQGTTFVVTMEYDICSADDLKIAVKKNIFDKLRGKRVLICEDQRINAEIVENMLEHMNVSVDIAKNGREGVALFSQSKEGYYDAILMDLRMPVMDGREAAVAIRAYNRNDAKKIPILFMSADVFADDRVEMLRAGGNEFVYKPVDMQELYEKLCKFILQN